MRDADHLIEIGCATSSLHLGDPNLEAQFGKGVHPEFDRLLSSMGHITRRKPTPLIDGLIAWKLGHDKQRDVPTVCRCKTKFSFEVALRHAYSP